MTCTDITNFALAIGCTPEMWPEAWRFMSKAPCNMTADECAFPWECALPDPNDNPRPWIGPCVEFLESRDFSVTMERDREPGVLVAVRKRDHAPCTWHHGETLAAAIVAACRAVLAEQTNEH